MSFLNALRVHNFVAKTTMLWTRLFLTRLKRRPNLSARAAFQVNSSAVFKEDVDIVPVIIDDTLSYMPWGGDNNMPFDILKLIEDAFDTLLHRSGKISVSRRLQRKYFRRFVKKFRKIRHILRLNKIAMLDFAHHIYYLCK